MELVAAEASRLHASSRQGDDLGVGDRTRRADQVGSDLVGLAALLEAAFVGREDRPGITQPQRKGRRAQLARHQPCHGHCPLTDQRHHVTPAVSELEQAAPLLDPEAEVEDVHVLDEWRDDVAVAPTPHLGEERFLRLAKDLRLEGKQVAEAGHAAQLGGHRRTTFGEETSGPQPLDRQLSSSSSSSASPSASSEKSSASPSSSTACIPSSSSSLAGVSATASSSSSSEKTCAPRVSRLPFVYAPDPTSPFP